MSPRTIVVFGSGPGIGNHVAAAFASHGFEHVILLARNAERLKSSDAGFVTSASPKAKVTTLRLDLADTASIPGVLEKIEEIAPEIEVVFFNAAVVQFTEGALSVSVETIETDFKVTNLALYSIAQWAVPRLTTLAAKSPTTKPSLLVTNSHLPWDPVPQLLSLSLVKAAQRNMVTSLSRAYGERGVHFGLITVQGIVSPEAKVVNPKNIAEKAWNFFEEGKNLEIVIKEE
ncbi:short-chain dehydrogenase/reductase-like protein SDR [Pleomassaria siparia CBS 279.74]|uniref:Short-chain dehydrogenase/reductase-like protein SDR n=1 Tax=Pleomassaria siparia CBS 279.74 TaxID=1314801 RepID=A0A6G1KQF9_9PLEO|nr:short-chain dehydrogenase/reductase-like protein SDR [Pleomassaria siparia CBS 279.74]